MTRSPVNTAPASTAQQLASVVKSARDIMRKDKGLSGELDRLPMLTWIMFLKFLDDMEQLRETEATLGGKRFVPAIEPPYRWRDWAASPGGIKGDELIAFINQDEAVRPDGTRGPGLFACLRSLQGADGGDRRDVIAAVFRGTVNRMINGYLLRDVLNKVGGIHFTSSDEIHTLSMIYESMLKEMRDAAGDSGEFYTPRPVVQFITAVVDPRLGETVLDPAAGTGGFLVAAFEHLKGQYEKVEDYGRLQRGTLFGVEAKPLPYLLCQMNMLLHGVESPNIDSGNALRFPLREIGDKDRVDVIMTNPPFGGEEERGILGNFPDDKQTAETALLFLQLVMRKLRRPVGGYKGGRCGIVAPNGVLFGDGVCARIKEELLREFNLHTLVRLPPGVFAPYTNIETNLLFFERSGPTKEVWYYGHPLPEGRKNYTKTKPLQFEEFAPCLAWWNSRVENEHAWRVPLESIIDSGYNLDIKNPNSGWKVEYLPPETLGEDILRKQQRISSIISRIMEQAADHHGNVESGWPIMPLRRVLSPIERAEMPVPGRTYRQIGVKLWGEGVHEREPIDGAQTKYKTLSRVEADDIIVNKIWARNGSVAVVPEELAGCYCSGEFPTFVPNREMLEPQWFHWLTKTPGFWQQCDEKSRGTSGKNRIRPERFLEIEIPVPSISEQRRLLALFEEADHARALESQTAEGLNGLLASVLDKAFKGEL